MLIGLVLLLGSWSLLDFAGELRGPEEYEGGGDDPTTAQSQDTSSQAKTYPLGGVLHLLKSVAWLPLLDRYHRWP